jgi:hemerythrin-like domain-containing protein
VITVGTQICLPGQAAAPDGPVDLTTMFVMHHAFRRDLAQFAEAAEVTPAADRTTWTALAERWSLFAEVLHHHHHGEDTGLWPLLMDRTDEGGRAVLAAMEAEHAEIDPLLAACAAGFARLSTTTDEDTRAALAVRLVAARESLGRHLVHEETEALVILQEVFTPQEWHDLETEHFRKPLGLRAVLRIVPWAASGLGEDDWEMVRRRAGVANELIWRMTRRRFAAREEVAFRHLR